MNIHIFQRYNLKETNVTYMIICKNFEYSTQVQKSFCIKSTFHLTRDSSLNANAVTTLSTMFFPMNALSS